MAFFKFIFYVAFYLLIKLGEAVYLLASGIIDFIISPFVIFNKSIKTHISTNKEKRQKKPKSIKKTMSLKSHILSDIFSKVIRGIFHGLKTTGGFVLNVMVKCTEFFLMLLYLPVRLLKSISHFRFRHRKRGRPKGPVKTPFFYKIKYLFFGSIAAFFFFFLPATFLIFVADLPKL